VKCVLECEDCLSQVRAPLPPSHTETSQPQRKERQRDRLRRGGGTDLQRSESALAPCPYVQTYVPGVRPSVAKVPAYVFVTLKAFPET
jgi:hypothetical protein